MTVHLDAGAMHALDPAIEFVLREHDITAIERLNARIGYAHRHGALGEGTVAGVFGSRAETDPFVAEAGGDPSLEHGIQHVVLGFIAHAMQKVAARSHLLQSK